MSPSDREFCRRQVPTPTDTSVEPARALLAQTTSHSRARGGAARQTRRGAPRTARVTAPRAFRPLFGLQWERTRGGSRTSHYSNEATLNTTFDAGSIPGLVGCSRGRCGCGCGCVAGAILTGASRVAVAVAGADAVASRVRFSLVQEKGVVASVAVAVPVFDSPENHHPRPRPRPQPLLPPSPQQRPRLSLSRWEPQPRRPLQQHPQRHQQRQPKGPLLSLNQ